MKQIQVLAQNKSSRGPGKVYQNLVKGLELLGHGVNQPIVGEPDLCVCLQMVPNINTLDPEKTLYGPNIIDLPSQFSSLFSSNQRRFISASNWIRDLQISDGIGKPENYYVWSVGIDTETWAPDTSKPKVQDCFIYYKNRSQGDLKVVELIMKKFNLKYSIVEYGKYSEQDLKNACNGSRFCIVLGNTETQGIAIMEIMSMCVPLYVFNKTSWMSTDGKRTCAATSVPYFDSTCGEVVGDVMVEHFSSFLDGLSKYSPRTYILKYHTLEKSAQNLLSLAHYKG